MRGVLAAVEATGVVGNTWMVATMAESYLKIGQAEEGLRMGPALALAQKTGDRLFEAELQRLKGEMLLIGDDGGAAKGAQCFRDAIEVARRQSAKSWELRATTSLARLLAKQGKRDEARAILAEIYNWFTEGFDTADLKDAKALLDELNG
jgi:predicted ATPase